jgi:hypothetical protein
LVVESVLVVPLPVVSTGVGLVVSLDVPIVDGVVVELVLSLLIVDGDVDVEVSESVDFSGV